MKQESGRRQPGIPFLQGGEDVKVWNSNRSTWHIAWIVPAILIAATAYGMLASLLVK
jgi:hypothetical protein